MALHDLYPNHPRFGVKWTNHRSPRSSSASKQTSAAPWKNNKDNGPVVDRIFARPNEHVHTVKKSLVGRWHHLVHERVHLPAGRVRGSVRLVEAAPKLKLRPPVRDVSPGLGVRVELPRRHAPILGGLVALFRLTGIYGEFDVHEWSYRERDSNPHALRQRILSPPCLPIPAISAAVSTTIRRTIEPLQAGRSRTASRT